MDALGSRIHFVDIYLGNLNEESTKAIYTNVIDYENATGDKLDCSPLETIYVYCD